MNLHDVASFFGRFIPGALAFARDFWSSLRTGEFRKRQRVWWRANWVFALIAFFLASLLYFRIRGELNNSGSRVIPVVVEVLGETKTTFADVVPSEIKVEVYGAENDVRRFVSGTDPIRLSVSKDKLSRSSEEGFPIRIKERRDIPGLRELGLRYNILGPGKTVVAKYDVPGDVEFSIEKPMIVGRPYHGEVAEVRCSPERVMLHGGQNWLKTLKDKEFLQLESINVDGLPVGHSEFQCAIKLPEWMKTAATLSPETNVTVSIQIVPSEKTKIFEKVPVRLSTSLGMTLPKGYRVTPQHVSATISGYEKSMETLSSADVTAYAVIPSIAALDLKHGATNTIPIKLEVPPDKEIWTVNPTPSAVKLIMPALPPVATNAPVLKAVTNAPAIPPVATDTPVLIAVTNAPGIPHAVTNAPIRLAATNAPALPSVTNAPAAETSAVPSVDKRLSNDKTEIKDNVENGKPKEQQ